MTIGERIKRARELRHPPIKVPELARRTGLSPSTLYDLEKNESKSTTKLHRVAEVLGVRVDWLETGAGAMREEPPPYGPEIQPGPDIRGLLPLISWVKAGNWSEVIDNFQPGDAEDWLACPSHHGPSSYCLRVQGESMYNPGGKYSYADGDIIFVDPDRHAKHGDRVIVRLEDQSAATFKQLIEEGSRRYLKALNPSWPERFIEINGNATICGVVIGKWVPE